MSDNIKYTFPMNVDGVTVQFLIDQDLIEKALKDLKDGALKV